YKQQRKDNELIIKLRIIRDVLALKHPKTSVAAKHDMGRNTVGNIIKAFNERIPLKTRQKLLTSTQTFSKAEIQDMLEPIKNQSTKPKGNKRSANKEQEEILLKYFHEQELSVGAD